MRYYMNAAVGALLCAVMLMAALACSSPRVREAPPPGGPLAPEADGAAGGADEPDGGGDGVEDGAFADLAFQDGLALTVSEFGEVWAYVTAGNEKALRQGYALTDVVYFGADVDRYGAVADIPRRRNLPRFGGRVHVSITCGSYGLTHFLLEPESRARAEFFDALVAMAREYDGLNVDMEFVPLKDAEHFFSLLGELKAALGGKVLSVCVPARREENQTYNYERVAAVVDRVFVMAYDEHWSTSKPGPVASMGWCKAVAAYALKTIGADKLIMGVPFYGRSWADKPTSRGLIAPTTGRIMSENKITAVERDEGVPWFTYDTQVTVTVYFEDAYSLTSRLALYRAMGVKQAGFWSLGQEDVSVWQYVKIAAPAARAP
jgi:hypothetical protein